MLRERSRAGWAVAALAVAGCTVVGSGKGSGVRLKVSTVEHPLTVSATFFRGDGFELVIERAFLGEARTILGPQYWRVFVDAVVVNTRGERLPLEALSEEKFTIVGRSGKVYPASASTRGSRGKTGWLLQEHTQEPTHLPPGARGLIQVFAQVEGKESPDPPVAFTFRDQRAELR